MNRARPALELLEEIPDLDVICTPVSGGGLLSGTAIAAKSVRPEIRVAAGEPSNADDAYRSLASGRIEAGSPNETTRSSGRGPYFSASNSASFRS